MDNTWIGNNAGFLNNRIETVSLAVNATDNIAVERVHVSTGKRMQLYNNGWRLMKLRHHLFQPYSTLTLCQTVESGQCIVHMMRRQWIHATHDLDCQK